MRGIGRSIFLRRCSGFGGAGFGGQAAEGFCSAVGGDFPGPAPFGGVPVNGFVL